MYCSYLYRCLTSCYNTYFPKAYFIISNHVIVYIYDIYKLLFHILPVYNSINITIFVNLLYLKSSER